MLVGAGPPDRFLARRSQSTRDRGTLNKSGAKLQASCSSKKTLKLTPASGNTFEMSGRSKSRARIPFSASPKRQNTWRFLRGPFQEPCLAGQMRPQVGVGGDVDRGLRRTISGAAAWQTQRSVWAAVGACRRRNAAARAQVAFPDVSPPFSAIQVGGGVLEHLRTMKQREVIGRNARLQRSALPT